MTLLLLINLLLLDDDGIVCENYNCTNQSMASSCVKTVEHCAIVSLLTARSGTLVYTKAFHEAVGLVKYRTVPKGTCRLITLFNLE